MRVILTKTRRRPTRRSRRSEATPRRRPGRRSRRSTRSTRRPRAPAACARRSSRASPSRRSTSRSSAPTEGELVGPFESDAGFYVIEVEKITPARDRRRSTTSTRADPQTLVAAAPAGGRDRLPGRLPDEVDRAHVLRRRLPDRPLLERRRRRRPPAPRSSPTTQGCDGARAVDAADRARHRRPSSARPPRRAAAGPDRRPAPGAGAARAAAAGPRRAPPGSVPPGAAPPGTAPPGSGAARPRAPRARRRRRAPPAEAARGAPGWCPRAGCRARSTRLDEITRRLRRECPWDREQDERSIVPHTVEEAYELADAAAARRRRRSCATSSATSSSRSSSSRCCSRSAARARWPRSPTRSPRS